MKFQLKTPQCFDLESTALTHGWVRLSPYSWDGTTLTSTLCFDGGAVDIRVRQASETLRVDADWVSSSSQQRKKIGHMIKYALNTDFPMHDFCVTCESLNRQDLASIASSGWGRPLRGFTPWEDAVKTLLTTNCTWSQTQKMVGAICQLGPVSSSGRHAFPSPSILKMKKRCIASLGLGYRSQYLESLLEIASNHEDFLWNFQKITGIDQGAAEFNIRALKGFGNYASSHLLVLLGWHEYLPIDREVLKYLNVPQTASGKIPRHISAYESFGAYRYTAYKVERIARKRNWIGDERVDTNG